MQEQEEIRNWRRSYDVYDAEQSTRSGDSNEFFFFLNVTLKNKTAIFRQSICETV
jgi:hypothetical protein